MDAQMLYNPTVSNLLLNRNLKYSVYKHVLSMLIVYKCVLVYLECLLPLYGFCRLIHTRQLWRQMEQIHLLCSSISVVT